MLEYQKDALKTAIQLCSIHCERMSFAFSQLEHYFPLDISTYQSLTPTELSYFDQLIFRFSKLQDAMGNKLFPAVLVNLGEDIQGKSFIDLLTKLEQLTILSDSKEWLALRETRNLVTHEYPFITDEIIDGLNLLGKHYFLIVQILKIILKYIESNSLLKGNL